MSDAFAITLADVERAARTIAGRVLRTPLMPAPRLSPAATSS
jgi:threonine dehydratase